MSYGKKVIVDYTLPTNPYTSDYIYMYNSNWTNTTVLGWPWYTQIADGGVRPDILYSGGGYGSTPCFMQSTTNATIQGLKFTLQASYTHQYCMYITSCYNCTIEDNLCTGQNTGQNKIYGMYIETCQNLSILNNKVATMGMNYTGNANGTSYIYYGIYFSGGKPSYTYTVKGNELTDLASVVPSANYFTIIYGIFASNGFGAGSIIANNLVHHMNGNIWGTTYSPTIGGIVIGNSNYGAYTIYNNTVDKINADYGSSLYSPIDFGIYSWDMSTAVDTNSNIVSNVNGLPAYMTFGYYKYYGSANFTYNLSYNVDDTHFYFESGSIDPSNKYGNTSPYDPMYVSTTYPYDYHLKTGSPAIGAGKGGVDMGCWGNLTPGQTVGLLTPE